jgi:anamorsin
MHGFTRVEVSAQGMLAAEKPVFKKGGTLLKKRTAKSKQTEEAANPWANLDEKDGGQIDEDTLMKDDAKIEEATKKFGNDGDRIMPGKPCENCTCGAKEVYEGRITTEQLETGQVESACGKCYLGDAFRCASCPFLGKPAFEPGDKVKLQNADVAQTDAGAGGAV